MRVSLIPALSSCQSADSISGSVRAPINNGKAAAKRMRRFFTAATYSAPQSKCSRQRFSHFSETAINPAGGKASMAERALPLTPASLPSLNIWQEITVTAKSAALADALSTAACLFEDRTEMDAVIAQFEGARIEAAVAV